jgi:phosphate transport system substrate-binding protein
LRRLVVSLCAAAVLTGTALIPARAAGPALTGAGSTFAGPFITTAFQAYNSAYGADVSYRLIGSAGGIIEFAQKRVDFGVAEMPLDSSSELPAAVAAGGPVLQVPMAIGGVSIAYNIPGMKTGLHLTGPVLARIFLGQITKWSDQAIKALNPGVRLPPDGIMVVQRCGKLLRFDASGAAFGLAAYLSKVSAGWRRTMGTDPLQWPLLCNDEGPGVVQMIQSMPDSIGYLDMAVALQNHMSQAALLNKARHYRTASVTTVAAAAAHGRPVAGTDSSIANASGKHAYPIAFYSWVLLFKHPGEASKAAALRSLFRWTATTGQSYARSLGYVPLPKNIQRVAVSLLDEIR